MADLKHCAQMADFKCHHPIEFLFPEYPNDRYTIQRDARSIGFFSWVYTGVGRTAILFFPCFFKQTPLYHFFKIILRGGLLLVSLKKYRSINFCFG